MIYLIDDKKTRQKDFGWTEEKFAEYANHLKPLYKIDDVVNIGEILYNDGNIILYHESFLDFTAERDKAVEQRNKIVEKAASIQGLSVAFFSGSQSSRSQQENVAHLPASILYQNLEVLIQQQYQHGKALKYLLFGETPEIEERLNEILTQENKKIERDSVVIPGNNLFIRPNSRFIQNAIEDATEGTIFNDVSDEKLSEKINDWLGEREYDNIFIPLCFGQTLSDFNGLRLATHIRCTPTLNQLTRIFIYGFVGLDYLINHEYFNILKTKNVELIPYNKKAFVEAAKKDFQALKINELPREIAKLKLDPPLNYADSHSIANEWAIYQWAKTIGCDETDELAKVFQNVETNLYFKYLRTTNPISEINKIFHKALKINSKVKPKVLLIDDEAEKGWKDFYKRFFNISPSISFDYFKEVNYKADSQDAIIDAATEKVKQYDPDVVLLDLRLQDTDFKKDIKPEEFTGYEILQEIKKINKGIQVIITTASNKVWNYEPLVTAGANGYIIKSGNSDVAEDIRNLKRVIEKGVEKASFLKEAHTLIESIKNYIHDDKVFDSDEKGTLRETLKINYNLAFELLEKAFLNNKYFNYAYLQLFLCIEEFLKIKSIFEYGDNCYVNQNIKVAEKDGEEQKKWKSIIKYNKANPPYWSIEENEDVSNINTDFKMSSVLIFLFNQEKSDFMNWPTIRDIRNKKAAHPDRGIVTKKEILNVLRFQKYIFNKDNRQEPSNKGLPDNISKDDIHKLKEKFDGN